MKASKTTEAIMVAEIRLVVDGKPVRRYVRPVQQSNSKGNVYALLDAMIAESRKALARGVRPKIIYV